MKRLILFCALFTSILFFNSGCTTYFSQYDNVENAKKLRVGMTKDQVLAIMGEPVKDEEYVKPDVLYYYIDTEWHDGLTTEDECLPLVFKDGKLIGWGNQFYEKIRVQREFAR
jgi:hypothetical protein